MKYTALFFASIKKTYIEKETLLVSLFSSLIALIGMTSLWLALGEDEIGGLTKDEVIMYYFILFVVGQSTDWSVFDFVSDEIRMGFLSNFLIKPLGYIKRLFVEEAGRRIINVIIYTFIALIVWLLIISKFTDYKLEVIDLVKVIPAILIAISIQFSFSVVFGSIAFYTTDSKFMVDLYWIIALIFSGNLIPLTFFPDTIYRYIQWNPFRFTYSLPLEILLHKLDGSEYFLTIGVGFFWLCIVSLVMRVTWMKGVKIYSAVGN